MARPDTHPVEFLSLPACRRLLGKAGDGVPDDNLERLRDQLYGVARCAVQVFERSTTDNGEETALNCLPADAREDVEERAAIIQFDAKVPRGLASRAAVSAYITGVKKRR
jgi:hypothetical protein